MKWIIYICFCSFLISQDIYTQYLIEDYDTLDVFSYQIPDIYDESIPVPLLVAFHQWGGNEDSPYYTQFDEEANERGWLFMSPYGGAANNYNNQGAQSFVENELIWMIENYAIDPNRIYMVGGSMGGASGAIYSNNHLNPDKPMVAATASGSGILDCERRAIEMDGNNSMIEWFGGNWDEVPFEYHRNSAIYFQDYSQSMHYNLQHLPIYLDFGVSEPHRTHAEEMYEILLEYNQNMWIDTEPTGSHGFSVMDEEHVCDWLSQFTLETNPENIHVNLDEPSRAYYIEALNQINNSEFINVNINEISDGWDIYNFSNSDSLVLHILDNNFENFILNLNVEINRLGITGPSIYNSNGEVYNFEALQIGSLLPLYYHITDNIIWLEFYGNGSSYEPDELPLIPASYIFEIQIEPFLNGDVNQDGEQNVQDIILIINHIIDSEELNSDQIEIADMNNDNNLDVLDIIILINIIINP